MSEQRLPSTVITQKLASQDAELSGTIAVSQLRRLAAALCSSEGDANVQLRFAIDDQRRRRVTAEVHCNVHVLCQRCLKSMPLSLDSSLDGVLVDNDEAAQQVPRHLDPVLTEDGVLNIYEFIEDELLLCLPFTSFHEYNCGAAVGSDGASQVSEKRKPFADLANIMKKS